MSCSKYKSGWKHQFNDMLSKQYGSKSYWKLLWFLINSHQMFEITRNERSAKTLEWSAKPILNRKQGINLYYCSKDLILLDKILKLSPGQSFIMPSWFAHWYLSKLESTRLRIIFHENVHALKKLGCYNRPRPTK